MMIEYDEKLSIESMLDRLIIFKTLENFEGSYPLTGNEIFYETINSDYMNYEDGLYNLTLFFEHGNIGEIILNPEFLQIELNLPEESYEGCLFVCHFKDLDNLMKMQAPIRLIEDYKAKIKLALEKNNDIEWFNTENDDAIEFVGITYIAYIHWHESVEELVNIIYEIRKDCEKYENSCDAR